MLFIKLKMGVETRCALKVENKFSCYGLLLRGFMLLDARFLTSNQQSQLERSENPVESGATETTNKQKEKQPLKRG